MPQVYPTLGNIILTLGDVVGITRKSRRIGIVERGCSSGILLSPYSFIFPPSKDDVYVFPVGDVLCSMRGSSG